MAVYFDYVVSGATGPGSPVGSPKPGQGSPGNANQGPGKALGASWSKDLTAEPLLACGFRHRLQLFSQEGEYVQDAIARGAGSIVCSDWHPTRRELMSGWNDGHVCFARPSASSSSPTNIVALGQEAHNSGASICCVKYSPGGDLCVASDAKGVVSVYNTENSGRAQYLLYYRKPGRIDKICFRGTKRSPSFFFAGEQGIVYGADEHGACAEKYKVGSPIILLEYCASANRVVLITQGTMLATFTLDADGKVRGETKLKLSCGPKPQSLRGVCIASETGAFLLATVSEESIVRLWNVLEEESYLLSLSDVDDKLRTDKAVAVDYNSRKRILAVGTKQGRVLQWRCGTAAFGESDWHHLAVRNFDSTNPVDKICWGSRIGESLLACVFADGKCVMLAETQLSHSLRAPFLGVQVAPSQVILHNVGALDGPSRRMQQQPDQILDCPFRLRGVSVGPPYVAIWSAKQVRIYMNNEQSGLQEHASFDRASSTIHSCCLFVTKDESSLLVCHGSKIEVCNLQGNVKKTLTFSPETEGSPSLVDIGGTTLVACTNKQLLRLWNLARATPKALGSGRRFEDKNGTLLGEVRQMRANSDGTRVALLADPVKRTAGVSVVGNHSPKTRPGQSPKHALLNTLECEPRVWVYDVEFDNFTALEIKTPGRLPVSLSWDPADPRLLAVEAVPSSTGTEPVSPSSRMNTSLDPDSGDEHKHTGEVLLVFASENTVLQQDSIPNPKDENSSLPLIPVSIVVPYVYFLRPVDSSVKLTRSATVLSKQVLRDFEGLEEVNAGTKKALLDFSYYIACGNPDEAYKAVSKNITSKAVWESLAKMCVKTRRLDVVQKCVGQLGNVRAATALRPLSDMKLTSLSARHEADATVKLATVAAHLGMSEDAEELYIKAGRHDLLNRLYQALNEWDKALDVAKTKDRIHLKTTYYNYASYLEAFDKREARKFYKLAGTEIPDCTRLLLSEGGDKDDAMLVEYVNGKTQQGNEKLQRWYAAYLESKQDLPGAIKCYTKSQDWHSLVRLHCFENDIETAKKVCEDTRDKAGCYYLAGVLEQRASAQTMPDDVYQGRSGGPFGGMGGGPDAAMIKEAIRFYSIAGCAKHAIRLADQLAGAEGDLMTLALGSGRSEDLIYAAKHYEKQGTPAAAAKAVTLYQKAGQAGRAMELCFSARLFEPLRKIVEEIVKKAESAPDQSGKGQDASDVPTADPELLARCAEFFRENEQHDKAVQLLCLSGQVGEAIDVCYQHGVHITEELAEKLTPEKTTDDKEEWRKTQLRKIAKLCKDQGSFQIACKKYTQGGEKVKAMKALLKSGDTERITFFAGTARTPEIYVLAANYLQSLDWHSRPEITKQILSFYSKAKDYRKMSNFYTAIAMVEIDEYRDYEKAASCLKDALKVLHKANLELSEEYQTTEKKLKFVEQFSALKTLKPDQVVQACETFLEVPQIENYLRIGDVFAACIEAYVAQGLYQDAATKVEEMKLAKIQLGPYVDSDVLAKIQNEVGTLVEEPVYENYAANWKPSEDEVDEEIDEEISDKE